jgi:hypothetical protein
MKLHPFVGILVGAVLASAVWFFAYQANASQLKQTSTMLASSNRTISQLEVNNAELRNASSQTDSQTSTLAAANENLSTQLTACAAKFARGTFLYDVGLLGGETRAWFIPADVEPVRIGRLRGNFSHYDPKSQTETVQMAAKTQ